MNLEIKKSTDFLIDIGASKEHLTACYPYGAYNQDAIKQLKQFGYKAAFTSKMGIAELNSAGNYELPRLDTNDVPKSDDAEPNKWLSKALEES